MCRVQINIMDDKKVYIVLDLLKELPFVEIEDGTAKNATVRKGKGKFRKDGDLVLRPVKKTWQDYFDRGRRFSDDFPNFIEDQEPEKKILW